MMTRWEAGFAPLPNSPLPNTSANVLSRRTVSAVWLLAAWIAVSGPNAQAQVRVTSPPRPLVSTPGVSYMDPEWSPDGASIAFTSDRYMGLWVADADGSNLRELSDGAAGFGFRWSPDSQSILTRVSMYVQRDQRHAVVLFDPAGRDAPRELTEYRSHMPSLPEWAGEQASAVWIPDAGRNRAEVLDATVSAPGQQPKRPAEMADAFTRPRIAVQNDRLLFWEAGATTPRDLSPFGTDGYLNARLSPDGSKVVFEHYGGNLHVMDVDGGDRIDLGPAYRPSWSPDSRHVVAMVTSDDGYTYTRSDLVVFAVDGTGMVNLTQAFDGLAMNPSWSPDGLRIAFDAPEDGILYVVGVEPDTP